MKSPAAIVGSQAGHVKNRTAPRVLKSNAGPNTEPEESENEHRKTDELRDRLATPNSLTE